MTSEQALFDRASRFVGVLAQCQELGISPVQAGKNHLLLKLPYQEKIVGNPDNGVIHGGAITTLMDTASGTVILCALPEFDLCPTLDLRVDYMRPAMPRLPVFARAKAYRITDNIIFTRCEAFQEVEEGGKERMVANCVATFMRIGKENSPEAFRRYIEEGGDITQFLIAGQAISGDQIQ